MLLPCLGPWGTLSPQDSVPGMGWAQGLWSHWWQRIQGSVSDWSWSGGNRQGTGYSEASGAYHPDQLASCSPHSSAPCFQLEPKSSGRSENGLSGVSLLQCRSVSKTLLGSCCCIWCLPLSSPPLSSPRLIFLSFWLTFVLGRTHWVSPSLTLEVF